MGVSPHEDVENATQTIQDDRPATFYVIAQSIAIGNNKSMLSILNADDSVIVRVHQIKIVNDQNAGVTGIVSNFQVHRLTGHSSGTLLTPISFDTTDSLDADVTVRTGSTVSGETTEYYARAQFSSDEWGAGAPDVESADHIIQQFNNVYERSNQLKPITLRQNQGITVKHTVNSTVGTFSVHVLFTQEST